MVRRVLRIMCGVQTARPMAGSNAPIWVQRLSQRARTAEFDTLDLAHFGRGLQEMGTAMFLSAIDRNKDVICTAFSSSAREAGIRTGKT